MNLNFEVNKNAITIDLDRSLIIIEGTVSVEYLDAIVRALPSIDKNRHWKVTGMESRPTISAKTWNTSKTTDE